MFAEKSIVYLALPTPHSGTHRTMFASSTESKTPRQIPVVYGGNEADVLPIPPPVRIQYNVRHPFV